MSTTAPDSAAAAGASPLTQAQAPAYPFFASLARMINSGQARSIILSGNVNDLFFDGEKYVPIVPFLLNKTRVPGIIPIVYELNGPIRVADEDRSKLRDAWAAWKTGIDVGSLAIKELTTD
ncbi:MAG: hypothetical protein ACTHOU_10040, partial [Aureliella sp.]